MKRIISLMRILWRNGVDELDKMRRCLIVVLAATGIGILTTLLFRPEMANSFWLSLLLWIYSGYRLFSISRYVKIHILGEALEGVKAVPVKPGILDNDLAKLYLKLITSIYFVQTILFLGVPLYVNYTEGGVGLLIPILMVTVAAGILMGTFFPKVFVAGAVVILLIFSVGIVSEMFPQIAVYTGYYEKVAKIIPGSNAKLINRINELRKRQIAEINDALLQDALEWQKNHPGEDLSEGYQEVIDASKRGITVTQLRLEKWDKLNQELQETKGKIEKLQASTIAPAPAPAPIVVKAETPEVKSPVQTIPNEVVIYWGDNFEKRFAIRVVCWDESSVRFAGGGRVFEGIKNSEGVYEGIWKRGSAHGHFSLDRSPDGNLIASGTVKDGTGEHSLQVRKT